MLVQRVIILAAAMSLLVPRCALASCERGATPSYNDIDAISVRQCGVLPMTFTYFGYNNGVMAFIGRRGTPILGGYSGSDGQPLFRRLVHTLEVHDFYSMRLKDSPVPYLDGPCETVKVQRCGVVTALGGLGDGLAFEADLNDRQTLALDDLVKELRVEIIGWPWMKEHAEPSP